MRIGIDASRLGGATHTGIERYSYEIIGAIAQLERDDPIILYGNGLPSTLPPLGPNVTFRSIPFPRLWTHLRLSWEMGWDAPDVLFVPAHVLPLIHPRRSVVTIHDVGYLAFPETHRVVRRLELHLSTLWNVRKAWRIITVSRATRDDLVHHYHVPVERMSVIPHGVSPRFRPADNPADIEAVRARYALPERYILYVGTIQPRKNIVRLIDAFAQIARSQSPAETTHLVLAGKRGWLTRAIEQRAAEHQLSDRVRFLGYVPEEDFLPLLQGAQVFAFPSLAEGFGMPVLEAMACGIPVLTSTTTALPEVAGDAALLVDPHETGAIAEGLQRLISDAALREELRARGLARAQAYSWERAARATLDVLMGNGTPNTSDQVQNGETVASDGYSAPSGSYSENL